MPEKEIRLKVREALQDEVYKGIVKIDTSTMRDLNVRPGDIVEIEGGRKTVGIVERAYPTDVGQEVIRMDGILRRNAKTGIGEFVKVRKSEIKEAKNISIAPAQEGVMIQADPEIFKRGLLGRAIVKGDIVVLGGTKRRRTSFTGSPFEDIFDIFEENFIGSFGFSGLKFIIADTNPKQPVIITEATEIKVSSKAVEVSEEKIPEVTYEDIGGLDEEMSRIREMVELPLRRPEIFQKLGISPPAGVLLHGPPGCLTGETLVALEDGKLIRMEELSKNLIPGVHIADLPVYPPAHAKAIHIYDVPETVEVILKRGRRLRLTPNHPLMTDKGWKEAEKLEVGNRIKIFNWIPSPTDYIPLNFIMNPKRIRGHCIIPKILEEKLALLLGVFVAEGSIEKWRIKFTINKQEKELREIIIKTILELFEVEVRELPDPQKNVLRLRFSHRYLEDFFKHFWRKVKIIPTGILLSPNSVASNFLKGLFEGDGSVVKSSPKYDRCITLKSKSRELLEECQTLLLRWSIKSSVHEYILKRWGEVYTLKITGKSNLLKFKENIGFISETKKEKLNNLVLSYKLNRTNEDVAEYEPIKKITKINGWQRVYDFEVPTTHSFFTNGILSHNTGKTLLAKAVANECEANFVLINGPEITCVTGDTEVLTNPEGRVTVQELFNRIKLNGETVRNDSIKEIVIPKVKIKLFSLNEKLKIVPNEVEAISKSYAPETYIIKTKKKGLHTTTKNHPFATLTKEGRIIWKTTKELKHGEYIAIASKIKTNNKNPEIKWWKNLEKENTFVLIDNKIKKLSQIKESKIKKIKGIKYSSIKSNIKRANFIKPLFDLSPLFMEFLGALYSDGYIGKEEITIAEKYPNMQGIKETYKNYFNKLFGIKHIVDKNEKVTVYSTILSEILTKGFGLPRYKKPKDAKLPKWLFKCTQELISAFIRGYYHGDGNQGWTKQTYPNPRIYSSNKEFLKDLQILYLQLGIISKITKSITGKGNTLFALEILDTYSREIFYKLVLGKFKRTIFDEWIKSRIRSGSNELLPDLTILLKSIKEELKLIYNKDIPETLFEPVISGRRRLTYRTLIRLIEIFKNNYSKKKNLLTNTQKVNIHNKIKKLDYLANADIKWDKILNIKKHKGATVYDISMKKYHNFFAGSPLTLLSNSKWYGETEKHIRDIFEQAEKNAPSIIFIDEIDSIAPKREETYGEVERRMVATLLAEMDGLKNRGRVIVIGATNRPNAIDPALRRPGRFDREISIGVPNKKGRLNILKIHTRNMPLAEDVKLESIAEITHGFVGADLSALSKEAAMNVLRKIIPELKFKDEEPIPKEILEKLRVHDLDFREALKIVRPSAMREVLVEKPNVKWDQVGGLQELKNELKEAVEWPLKNPQSFKRLGIRPTRGILLYGPPGTGKTLLAKAVATESEANFILVKGAELLSMWIGESEKGVKKIFERARQVAPTIIFFDEIDALASRRGRDVGTNVTERVVNQLLAEMDGLEELNDVLVLAATNRPDLLDAALLRPGRFDRIISTSLPDKKSRFEILKIHTTKIPLAKDVKLEKLSEQTENFVGADIEMLCREAAMNALREDIKVKEVTMKNFEHALKKIKSSVTDEDIKKYKEIENQYLKSARGAAIRDVPSYMG